MARTTSGTGCAEGNGGGNRRMGKDCCPANRDGMLGTGGMTLSCGGGGGENIRCLLPVVQINVRVECIVSTDDEPLREGLREVDASCSSSLSRMVMGSMVDTLGDLLSCRSAIRLLCDGLSERKSSSSSSESTSMTSINALLRRSGITGIVAITMAPSTLAIDKLLSVTRTSYRCRCC
jgi:hypothetical protein